MTKGYRGYNGSRPYQGMDFPQHAQNFIIRHYCQKHHLTYLLSASEYKMPGCFMILQEIVSSIEALDGIVLFSLFMLPETKEQRMKIYEKVLSAGCSLHGALEDIAVRDWKEVEALEDILMLNHIARTDQAMEAIREFVEI